LSTAGVQLGDKQAGGSVPEFHRRDREQQAIPVVGDQLVVDRLAQQRSGVGILTAPAEGGSRAVELKAADVADVWGELQSGQVEDRERGQCLSGGVDGVLAKRQIRWIAEDLIEHHDGLAPGAENDLGAVGGVLVGMLAECTYSKRAVFPRLI
jgi:hypothetical protein